MPSLSNNEMKRFRLITIALIICLLFHSVDCRRLNETPPLAQDDSRLQQPTSKSTSTLTSSLFPPYHLVLEMVKLSHTIYKMKKWTSCANPSPSPNATDDDTTLPPSAKCQTYIHNTLMGTQVMVVTSSLHKYIAVVFAGTDDLRTVSSDVDVLTASFGGPLLLLNNTEEEEEIRDKLRVHAGFEHAVFNNNMFDNIASIVNSLLNNTFPEEEEGEEGKVDRSDYQIITTGHSLGGANAILASAAFSALYPTKHILSITFGCPRTGTYEWSNYYNSLTTTNIADNTENEAKTHVSLYRYVRGKDIVPRLPSYPFRHVGHTIQMDDSFFKHYDGTNMKAYYLHSGNGTLGYAGVPTGWDAESVDVFDSLYEHRIKGYVEYIESRNGGMDLEDFYVSDFERLEKSDEGSVDSVLLEEMRK